MYKEYQSFKKGRSRRGRKAKVLLPTGGDILGPFYKEGAPLRNQLCDVPSLCVLGMVVTEDFVPIVGALLDFWQADKDGKYDLEGTNFRGKQKSGSKGEYEIYTVRPGDYQIDDDEFRCAHIHAKVSADGFKPLTTQLYFPNDKYNETDRWFDPTRMVEEGVGRAAGLAFFNFVLTKEET